MTDPGPAHRYQHLFAELKRRRVFRVMAVYGAVAFVVLQVADLAFPRLGMPEWTVTFILLTAMAGFPIAIVLAWAFDMTPEGVQKTQAAAPGEIDAIVSAPASQRVPAGLMALAGMIALLVGAWWVGTRTAADTGADPESASTDLTLALSDPADDDRPSIAVLPFANMSADEEREYFSDGITEEILYTLVRVRELKVVARTSAFAFKGRNVDARDIGDSLGARYLIEGSVRKSGDELRITAQLIDARDGTHLWSDQYDRSHTDVFAIQTEIAEAIAVALRVPLGLDDPSDLVTPTADVNAYDLYLAGRARLRERAGSLPEAIRLFEEAIARDSAWAPAWAGLAEANEVLAWYPDSWEGGRPESDEERDTQWALLMDQAEDAARRALELNPNTPGAHVALGSVLRNRRDWTLAEAEYLKALEQDPDNAEAHDQYAQLLNQLGRSREAIPAAERALALDRVPVRFFNLAIALAVAGQHDAALAANAEAIRLNTGGHIQGLVGQRSALIVNAGRWDLLRDLGGGWDPEAAEPVIKALEDGRFDDVSRELFEEVFQLWGGGGIWSVVLMHSGQHDEAAQELLDRARAGRYTAIWSPVFDPIRGHPAYPEVLREMNLEGRVPDRPAP